MTSFSSSLQFGGRVIPPSRHGKKTVFQVRKRRNIEALKKKPLTTFNKVPVTSKAQIKRIQTQLLKLPTEILAQLRHAHIKTAKTARAKRIISAAKKFPYPIHTSSQALSKMLPNVSKSPISERLAKNDDPFNSVTRAKTFEPASSPKAFKLAPRSQSFPLPPRPCPKGTDPNFLWSDFSKGSQDKCKEAAQQIIQAEVILNKGQHFAVVKPFLDKACTILDSIASPEHKKLLKQSNVYDCDSDIDVTRLEKLVRRVSRQKEKNRPLNEFQKAVMAAYLSYRSKANISFGLIRDLGQIWSTQKRKWNGYNGAYPILNPDGSKPRISVFSEVPGKIYPEGGLQRLLEMPDWERRWVINQNIYVRRLKDSEKGKYEGNIKYGAFYNRDLAKNEFIDFCGGNAIPPDGDSPNREYGCDAGEHFVICGTSPFTRANTTLIYNRYGSAIGESGNPRDFNARLEASPGTLDELPIDMLQAFTTRATKKDEEVRWPYGYPNGQVAMHFNPSRLAKWAQQHKDHLSGVHLELLERQSKLRDSSEEETHTQVKNEVLASVSNDSLVSLMELEEK